MIRLNSLLQINKNKYELSAPSVKILLPLTVLGVQSSVTPENIAKKSLEILNNQKRIHEIKENLKDVKSKLGDQGASSRAAHIIHKFFS